MIIDKEKLTVEETDAIKKVMEIESEDQVIVAVKALIRLLEAQ